MFLAPQLHGPSAVALPALPLEPGLALGLYVVLLPVGRTLPILIPIIIAATMPNGISEGILDSMEPSYIVSRSQN